MSWQQCVGFVIGVSLGAVIWGLIQWWMDARFQKWIERGGK